jgi:hypothetical protein
MCRNSCSTESVRGADCLTTIKNSLLTLNEQASMYVSSKFIPYSLTRVSFTPGFLCIMSIKWRKSSSLSVIAMRSGKGLSDSFFQAFLRHFVEIHFAEGSSGTLTIHRQSLWVTKFKV